ncbi:hypothetical protein L1049_026637 [Liquidambar formosana]|uniref:Uncharacterized protein n=1 Tax=Liquidambar formosana TaxID=63359 RepID=A0AAP0R873_LIQFO
MRGSAPPARLGGSSRIVSVDVSPGPNIITTNTNKDFDNEDSSHQKPRWRKFLAFVGPGFLVSLAYLDPGNSCKRLELISDHVICHYQLLWVILIGLVFALIIQSLAANLGVSTVIGTAFALNILFNIPLWVGVLCTVMVFILAGCYFGEMSYVKPPASSVLKGMFIPKLSGQSATGDAIALLGALIMPHNLFLHSALVLSRKIPPSIHGINDACRFFLIESGIALFIAFLINVAVISVSGTVCTAMNLSQDNSDRCNDLTLNSASFLLKGFLDLKMRRWVRNLLTRCIAITPSLIVSIIGGSAGSGRLIIIASRPACHAVHTTLTTVRQTIHQENNYNSSRFQFQTAA